MRNVQGVLIAHNYSTSATGGDTGARWHVDKENKTSYTVEIHSEKYGVHGTLNLTSISTARYPCDTVPNLHVDITQEVAPGLGWTNQVPAANAAVSSRKHPFGC